MPSEPEPARALTELRSGLALRAEEPGDWGLLLELYTDVRADEMALVPWDQSQKDEFVRSQLDARERFYHDHIQGVDFRVVMRDGRPIGRLAVARTGVEIRVVDIALLPGERSRGLGTVLIRQLQDEAREAGLPLRLHADQGGREVGLYLRLGFREVDREGLYVAMEWLPHALPPSPGSPESDTPGPRDGLDGVPRLPR